MGLAPLGDRIFERLVTWRIGSATIYKRLVKGDWDVRAASYAGDGIYKQLVTPGIRSTSSWLHWG